LTSSTTDKKPCECVCVPRDEYERLKKKKERAEKKATASKKKASKAKKGKAAKGLPGTRAAKASTKKKKVAKKKTAGPRTPRKKSTPRSRTMERIAVQQITAPKKTAPTPYNGKKIERREKKEKAPRNHTERWVYQQIESPAAERTKKREPKEKGQLLGLAIAYGRRRIEKIRNERTARYIERPGDYTFPTKYALPQIEEPKRKKPTRPKEIGTGTAYLLPAPKEEE